MSTSTRRSVAVRRAAREPITVPPFRTAHRGAGARYVSSRGVTTAARAAAVRLVILLAAVGALAVMGWVGREDVRQECRAAAAFGATDDGSLMATRAACVEQFGPLGY